MEQQIYGRPEFEPNVYTPEIAPEPVAEQPRYRLPSYGSVDVGGPTLRLAEMDPELRIKKLKADAQAKNADKKRQADRILLPTIQEDMTRAAENERLLQSELEKTRQALEQPYQRPGMDQYDMIAAGLSGIFGGAQGFNQATAGAFQRSDQQYDQNYQVQRQNAVNDFEMAQAELADSRKRIDSLKNAYLNAVSREDDFERDLVLQQLKQEAEKESALLDHTNRLEIEQQKAQGRISLEQAKREGKLDPAAVSFWKGLMANSSPEARPQVLVNAMAQLGLQQPPNELLEAVEQLNIREQNTAAKTQTEDETRPGKVAKLAAEVKKIIGATALDETKKRALEQKIAYYPEEFQARMASAHSLVANRESLIKMRGALKVGGPSSYYGKGDESKVRSGYNVAKATLDALNEKRSTLGGWVAGDEDAFMQATSDLKLFENVLKQIQESKVGSVRDKYAPMSPFAGEITPQGTQAAPAPKPKPKDTKPAPKPGNGIKVLGVREKKS